jgi:hypothetical protein
MKLTFMGVLAIAAVVVVAVLVLQALLPQNGDPGRKESAAL